jgi:hypothetical protein
MCISVLSSPQLHLDIQVGRLRVSFLSTGQVAVGACLGSEPDGESSCQPMWSSPKGVCTNRGEHGDGGLVHCVGLGMLVNSPQVEKEARYEPVRRLREHERAWTTMEDLRRLHAPFRINGNIHQRSWKHEDAYCDKDPDCGLQAVGTVWRTNSGHLG